jgi:TetR/AcrR family transcriptional regulator, transcriptional repressor for nem operon
MPYPKAHKEKSRQNILESAYQLFTANGYDAVTVNHVMADCAMTRGAFYGHFTSKSDLYCEALNFAFLNSKLVKSQQSSLSEKQRIINILDGYLSVAHVQGNSPCPLAFLATDIATQDTAAKQVYADAYINVNKIINQYANTFIPFTENETLALTSMIIGTVAIARTIENMATVEKMLAACRYEAGLKLGGI